MVSVPIFSTNTWRDSTTSYDTGLGTIWLFKEKPELMR